MDLGCRDLRSSHHASIIYVPTGPHSELRYPVVDAPFLPLRVNVDYGRSLKLHA